jgi:hypothetical protein
MGVEVPRLPDGWFMRREPKLLRRLHLGDPALVHHELHDPKPESPQALANDLFPRFGSSGGLGNFFSIHVVDQCLDEFLLFRYRLST